MSGTSLDGIDAVVADFASGCKLLAATHIEFPSELRRELLALQESGPDEIVRAARAANALADLYAHAIRSVCMAGGIETHELVAAGVHGQTIRHRPHEGWTAQVNNPSRVAEKGYVTVVADFRMRDIAAGGHGAPLVPAFHAAMFRDAHRHRVVANLGGIANITDLPSRGAVRGFDTGPGNVLLDAWHARHRASAFDAGGALAAAGAVQRDCCWRCCASLTSPRRRRRARAAICSARHGSIDSRPDSPVPRRICRRRWPSSRRNRLRGRSAITARARRSSTFAEEVPATPTSCAGSPKRCRTYALRRRT
jgi:anhydro-N-acetylmuramic acid kinase